VNNSYFSGLNHHILGGIEGVPVNCLEIGCAYGRLGEAIKRKFPGVYYVGIDQQQDAVIEASKVLDLVLNIDLNSPGFMHEINQAIGTVGFDLIIIGDTLEHLCQPEQLLESLHHLSADNAQLILCVPNSAHYSVIERVFTGDLSYDSSGLLDNTHLRLFSPASCLKIMLNTGWLPSIYDQIIVPMPRTDYYKQLSDPYSISSATRCSSEPPKASQAILHKSIQKPTSL
jgi:2-polyprenyl-3-methyl-5-hydroxy-6-metoxy-1,4-benzoquinol methylase